MPDSPDLTLTIGRLARAAGVGVETVRYYQRRGLLPVPAARGAYRRYPQAAAERIRFVRRAQQLGFSLAEIRDLLALEDGADRDSVRRIAGERLAEIEQRLADLENMRAALAALIEHCRHGRLDEPCPIIATLGGKAQA